MRIQHNILAMNSYRNYTNNTGALGKNLEKLSSGYRINRAGDDAAGLAISEKMRAQITGLDAAQKNVQDGISLVKTAEGAMQEIQDMLNRMKYLAVQSANGTYENEVDRKALQDEVDALKSEINRIADSANFNGQKLLDGSMGAQASTSMKELAALDSVNMADGITINAPVDGAGAKQTYNMSFGEGALFGVGDSVTFDIVKTSDNSRQTITLSYDAAAVQGNNDNKFKGDTLEDQLNSMIEELNSNTAFTGSGYSVAINEAGDGLVFTAAAEGAPEYILTGGSITDAQTAAATAKTASTGTLTGSSNGGKMAWKLLSGDNNSVDISDGDKLEFTFNVNGKAMTVTLTAGEDFQVAPNSKLSETTTNIANALSNATFDENDSTDTVQESLLKVSDYFTFTPNSDMDSSTTGNEVGVIGVAAKAVTGAVLDIGNVKFTEMDGGMNTQTTITPTIGTAKVAGTATAEIVTVTPDRNFSAGEKFTVAGTLKDGRTFSIELTATNAATAGENEFTVGAALTNSLTAIVDALKSESNKVTITNADGTTEEMAANKLFGGTGDNKDFAVTSDGTKLSFTNEADKGVTGKGLAAQIDVTKTKMTSDSPMTTSMAVQAEGKEQSKAENKLTFDPTAIEQGTTLEIDGKTYEFVTDAKFVTKDGNVAVVVENLGSDSVTGEEIAQALADAMDNADTVANGVYSNDNGTYDLTVDGNSLTISSQTLGETAKALSVKQLESKESAVVEFNTNKTTSADGSTTTTLNLKAGDTVTINGQVYEFYDGKRTSDENAVGIKMDGITTAEQAAEALANAVNEFEQNERVGGYETIARAEGGKVILTSKYDGSVAADADPYAAPEVDLPASANGLILQIGDTADKYNQLNVTVDDMHVDALGMGEFDISTLENAQVAETLVTDAINRVSSVRGRLGAIQNRLEHTANNLSVMEENIQNAESAIRDTDIADEMTDYTKNNILLQSAQAMLAQANQVPQGVLQLLQ